MGKKVLVVGHERAGNHFLINSIVQNFDFDSTPVQHGMPCIELPICAPCQSPHHGRGSAEHLWKHNKQMHKACLGDYLDLESKIDDGKRVYKTHLDFDFFTEHDHDDYPELALHGQTMPMLLKSLSTFKIFYITRDPKDTLLSLYLYLGKTRHPVRLWDKTLVPSPHWRWQPDEKTLKEFLFDTPPDLYEHASSHVIDHYDTEKFENFIERWYVHNLKWTEDTDVQIISYENLSKSFDQELNRIATLIGLQAPEELTKPTIEDPCIAARKGVIGDHKHYFTEEIDKTFNSLLGKYKKKYGALPL